MTVPEFKVPSIGLGTFGLYRDAQEVVKQAISLGYTHVDTASAYVNETSVGLGISDSEVEREKLFIATKFPEELSGQEEQVLRFSLKCLGLDYLDIWYLHGSLPREKLIESWAAFSRAKHLRQTRFIGVCNFTVPELETIASEFGEFPDFHQTHLSLDDSLPYVEEWHSDRGVTIMAHSPFRGVNLGNVEFDEYGQRCLNPYREVLNRFAVRGIPVVAKSASQIHLAENLQSAAICN